VLDLTTPQRTELVLALDDRISYLDDALKAIDSRLKVVDAILGGKVQCSAPVSRTTLEASRASTIAHIVTVLECYRLLRESPSVQASILISELNLKAS
jgi:hypothetical protein